MSKFRRLSLSFFVILILSIGLSGLIGTSSGIGQTGGNIFVTIQPGETKTIFFGVWNDDKNQTKTFTFKKAGAGSEFITLPANVTFAPDEKIHVKGNVTIPSDFSCSTTLVPQIFAEDRLPCDSPFCFVLRVMKRVFMNIEVPPPTGQSFIVLMKGGITTAEIVEHQYGIKNVESFNLINGFVFTADEATIETLGMDDRIIAIVPDKEFTIFQTLPTGIDRINAELSPLRDSVNAKVGIIDTGIAPHPDLKIVGGFNGITCPTDSNVDDNGHGTHVAGIVNGVAPNVDLYSIKVLDASGSGRMSNVIKGIEYAVSQNLDVINLSLGGSGQSDGNCGLTNNDPLHMVICEASKSLTIVVAAGNSRADASTQIPAAYKEVITVSAIADFDGKPQGLADPTCRADQDDTLADFSNFGQVVDIAAPGVCILSTWLNGEYRVNSGTSMAAPHVAGAIALGDNSTVPQDHVLGFTGDFDGFAEPLLMIELEEVIVPPEPSDLLDRVIELERRVNVTDTEILELEERANQTDIKILELENRADLGDAKDLRQDRLTRAIINYIFNTINTRLTSLENALDSINQELLNLQNTFDEMGIVIQNRTRS